MYLAIAVAACVASFLIGVLYANQKNETAKNPELDAIKHDLHKTWSIAFEAGMKHTLEMPDHMIDNYRDDYGINPK